MESTTPTLLRFSDLKARGVVHNRMSLHNWIKKEGFPPGRLLGPHSRVWTEGEVAEWLAARPTEMKAPLRGAAAANRKAYEAGEVTPYRRRAREADAA